MQIDQYPTARWASTEARIDPDQQRAELLLTLASGPAFTLARFRCMVSSAIRPRR